MYQSLSDCLVMEHPIGLQFVLPGGDWMHGCLAPSSQAYLKPNEQASFVQACSLGNMLLDSAPLAFNNCR